MTLEFEQSGLSTANSAAADQAHRNFFSEAYDHVKNTWTDVVHGNATPMQYLEAAGEVAAVGALTYGAIRGGAGLTPLLKGEIGSAPELTMGQEAIGSLAPHLNEVQLTKMAADMKLFPAAGHLVDAKQAGYAVDAIVRNSPALNPPGAVGALRSVEGGYQTLGQHEKAIEIIDQAIGRSRGLPNRLSFGLLPEAQRVEPLFYLDKSESLAALGRDGQATKALNQFANRWGAEKLVEKYPGLADSDALKLVQGVVPKFELSSVQNGGRIFDDITKSIKDVDVPKELIKPPKTVEQIWLDGWREFDKSHR